MQVGSLPDQDKSSVVRILYSFTLFNFNILISITNIYIACIEYLLKWLKEIINYFKTPFSTPPQSFR